jgi:hypothetical protein
MPKDIVADQKRFAREQLSREPELEPTTEMDFPKFEGDSAKTTVTPPSIQSPKAPPVPRGKAPIQPTEYQTTVTTTQTVRPADPKPEVDKPEIEIPVPVMPSYSDLEPEVQRFAQCLWHITYKRPPSWRVRLWKISLPQEEIDNVPQGTIDEVLYFLSELPPASYRFKIETEKGIVENFAFQPVFDTRPDSPNFVTERRTTKLIRKYVTGYRENADQTPRPIAADHSGASASLLTEAERLRQQRVLMQEKRDTEQLRNEIERERERDRAEGNKMNETVMATLAEMRREIQDAKAAPKGPTILEILTAATPLISAYITAQSSKGSEFKDALNLIIETNKAQQTMQLEQLKEMRETAQRLIDKQASNPMDQVKMILDLQSHARKETLEMIEAARGNDGGDDEINIDPNNVTGSLFAEGVKALISAFKSGGPEIVKMIASRVGKPPEQVTETDLAALSQRLQHMPAQPQQPRQFMPPQEPRALPLRPQAHPSPATVGATLSAPPVQFNPADLGQAAGAAVQKPTVDAVAIPATQTEIPSSQSNEPAAPVTIPEAKQDAEPTPAPTETLTIETQGNVGISTGPGTVVTPTQVLPVTPVAPVAVDADLHEADLREHVDVCLRQYMLVDLQTERAEHEWQLYAAQKFHRDFLMKLVLLESNEQRMAVLKSKADPALMAEIERLWFKEGSKNFDNMKAAWDQFVLEVMQPAPSTPPEAPASPAETGEVKA